MAGNQGVEPQSLESESNVLAITPIPYMAGGTGVEPISLD